MKKLAIILPTLILFFIAIYLFFIPIDYSFTAEKLSTIVNIKYQSPNTISALNLKQALIKKIDELDAILNSKIASSELSYLNRNAEKQFVAISSTLYNLIKQGIYYGRLLDGAFDITIKPVLDLWQFGSHKQIIPTETEIQKAIQFVDYQNIVLDDVSKKVKFSKSGMKIDLGGIAKGFIIDECRQLFNEYSIKSGIIEIGGDVYLVGNKPNGAKWRIKLQNPRINELQGLEGLQSGIAILKATEKAIVTSGDYERGFVKDNKRYHHIIDPSTGYPAYFTGKYFGKFHKKTEETVISVTVLANNTTQADALSTGFFVLGVEKSLKICQDLEGVDVMFVSQKGNQFSFAFSKGFMSFVSKIVTIYKINRDCPSCCL